MTVKVREIYPGRWYLQIDYHRYRKTKFISTNRLRAEEAAKRLQEALDLHGFDAITALEKARRPAPQIPLLRDYAKKWEIELDHTDLRKSTVKSYKQMMRNHVVPILGDLRLNEVDYSRLKEFALSKAKTHSRDSVRLMFASLRALMQEAIRDKHIYVNPVTGLARFYRAAPIRKEEMDPFTLEELAKLEEKFRERFPEYYAFFFLLSRTGMRIGEAIALQWRDIDWRAGEILVRRNLPGHRHLEKPKTRSSQRRVDMIPRLAEELRQWRKYQKKLALIRGEKVEEQDWIWTTRDGTPIHYSNWVRRVWHRVQALAEVRQRNLHQLRHTWASHMLAAGADPAWIARQLGHSSPLITLKVYAHWVPGAKRVTAEVLDGRGDTQITRKCEDI